jgi:Bacteriophage protein of unknown function (DUF646).
MAGAVFDFHELDDFNKKMVRFYSKEFPGEVRKFMNKEGNDGKRILRKYTKAMTTKHTGNLLKGIDKGKVEKKGDDWQVRVKFKKPAYHAWLVEHGHGLVAWGKPTDKRVEGRHMAARSQKAMQKHFTGDVERWVDKMLKEGLR